MNLSPLIKRTVLIAIALVLEKIDRKITEEQNNLEATQKPLSKRISEAVEAPKMNSPTKYTRGRYKPSEPPARPYIRGIITSTTATSKYSPEELRAFYKINPYTNL